jgi:uncharacterized protein YaeQ
MALGATIYRFHLELADVGRGVYEPLELRVARHPSESARRMLARVLAYALEYEEGIEFGRGVSTTEEPAISVRDLRGDLRTWIDVGQPSAERLHKAAKLCARVAVYGYADPTPWLAELGKHRIHRHEELDLVLLPASLLDPLEASLDRTERWSLTVSEGNLYLTRGDETLEGSPERRRLA